MSPTTEPLLNQEECANMEQQCRRMRKRREDDDIEKTRLGRESCKQADLGDLLEEKRESCQKRCFVRHAGCRIAGRNTAMSNRAACCMVDVACYPDCFVKPESCEGFRAWSLAG